MIKWTLPTITASIVAAFAVTAASAQQPKPVPVAGVITAVDGQMLTVKARDGATRKVKLKDDAKVFAVAKAMLADIKPNSFIGVGAMPQPDGSQKAIQVTIFAESQRGLGEGFRPWNRPHSTMTNATVAQSVKGVDGPVLTVRYKGGEKKIIVPPDAKIRAYLVSSRSELKPGADIAIRRAIPQPDGTFVADRVNVGRGIKP